MRVLLQVSTSTSWSLSGIFAVALHLKLDNIIPLTHDLVSLGPPCKHVLSFQIQVRLRSLSQWWHSGYQVFTRGRELQVVSCLTYDS